MPRYNRRVRRYPVRGRAKRNTTWVDLVLETSATDNAATTIRVVTLFTMADELEGTTCLRIVGNVSMGLQVAGGVVAGYWGIYFEGDSGGLSSFGPNTATFVSSEDVMMWRAPPLTIVDTGEQLLNTAVDIRSKRKLVGGDSIGLNFQCSQAYSSMANLRGLFYSD